LIKRIFNILFSHIEKNSEVTCSEKKDHINNKKTRCEVCRIIHAEIMSKINSTMLYYKYSSTFFTDKNQLLDEELLFILNGTMTNKCDTDKGFIVMLHPLVYKDIVKDQYELSVDNLTMSYDSILERYIVNVYLLIEPCSSMKGGKRSHGYSF